MWSMYWGVRQTDVQISALASCLLKPKAATTYALASALGTFSCASQDMPLSSLTIPEAPLQRLGDDTVAVSERKRVPAQQEQRAFCPIKT